MSPKSPFQRLPLKKQQELLNTAMKLYAEHPYEKITVRLLCREMGLNSATFYRYFNSKDDLLLYLSQILINREVDYLLVELDCKSVDADSFFPEFSSDKPDYYSQLEHQFLLAVNQMPLTVIHNLIFHLSEANQRYYRAILEREQAAGKLRPGVDIDLIAYMYATTGYNLLIYCMDHGLDQQEYIRRKIYFYYDFFYHGILLPDDPEACTDCDSPDGAAQ